MSEIDQPALTSYQGELRGQRHRTQVLIVGGGPVGLALSIELGWRGIHSILVDRRDGLIPLPKMNGVSARTMEFCRRWGISDAVRDAGWPQDYPVRMVYATSVRGHEFFRYDRGTATNRLKSNNTPEHFQRCPQTWFDPLLREHSKRMSTNTLRYHTKLERFKDVGAQVEGEVIDLLSGTYQTIEADFMVACDGGKSGVRSQLGIATDGNALLSREVNVYFECSDVYAGCEERRAVMTWLVGCSGVWGAVSSIDGRALWRLWLTNMPEDFDAEDFDARRAVCDALGADVDFKITGVLAWDRQQLVARKFSKGRVFLCGDAVHSLTPTGGFGMNTGIQDAVDLGWKLAASLNGWGGAYLLESYEQERRPVAVRNVDEATHTFSLISSLPALECLSDEDQLGLDARRKMGEILKNEQFKREFQNEGIVLGYRYDPSPICIPESSVPAPDFVMSYHQTARPGSRAPHAWLSEGRSIIDLFGRGFVLLDFAQSKTTVDALVSAAKTRKVPLEVVHIGPSHQDLYEARLVLVRPDGHVAWRGESLPGDAMKLIDQVRGAFDQQIAISVPEVYNAPPQKVSIR